MTGYDPHNDWGSNWPPGPIERQIRAELADATAHLEWAKRLVEHHEEHSGGLIPACQARHALGMGPRPRPRKETSA